MVDLVSAAGALSAGANLVGSLGSVFGGGGLSARKAAAYQHEYNKRMAEYVGSNSIQWRVNDAKRAGVHPLYALGAPSISPPSSHVGSDANSLGDRLSQAGQGISRAINAYSDRKDRARFIQQNDKLNNLKIQNAELQNARLAAETELIRHAATKPISNPSDLVVDGQGDAHPTPSDVGIVTVDPSRRTSTFKGKPSTEAAVSPANKAFQNADGSITIWPSKDAKDSIEDTWYEYEHIWRNRIKPWLDSRPSRPVKRFSPYGF